MNFKILKNNLNELSEPEPNLQRSEIEPKPTFRNI